MAKIKAQTIQQRIKFLELTKQYATEDETLSVCDCDNDLGLPKRPQFCSFARASGRKKGVFEAHFYNRFAWLFNILTKTATRYSLRKAMKRAIKDFDNGIPVPTGEWILHALQKSERPKNKRSRDNGRNKTGTKSPKRRKAKQPVDVYLRSYEGNIAA